LTRRSRTIQAVQQRVAAIQRHQLFRAWLTLYTAQSTPRNALALQLKQRHDLQLKRDAWHSLCAIQIELKSFRLVSIAKIKQAALKRWRKYITSRSKVTIIQRTIKCQTQQQIVQRWHKLTQRRLEKQRLQAQINEHRRRTIQSNVFQCWKSQSIDSVCELLVPTILHLVLNQRIEHATL
jgi:hypothetical protein